MKEKVQKKVTSNIERRTSNVECGAASRSYLVAGIQHRLSAEASCEGGSIVDEQACPEQSRRKQRSNHPKETAKKRIELSWGKFAIVDVEDFERVNSYKWCSVRMGQVWYAQTLSPDGSHLSMHRLITNAPKQLIVDHKDHNGLNNRRSNLRLCTQQQNIYNRRPQSGGSSRHKGVHWDKKFNQYRAKICHKSKQYHLGRFDNEDDAGRAYDRKAIELFGEFAYLNFPEDG